MLARLASLRKFFTGGTFALVHAIFLPIIPKPIRLPVQLRNAVFPRPGATQFTATGIQFNIPSLNIASLRFSPAFPAGGIGIRMKLQF